MGNHSNYLSTDYLVSTAKTKPEYTLVDLGYFPGLLDNDGSTSVTGELYRVNNLVLNSLNALEGVDLSNPEKGLYRLELIELSDGGLVYGYVYNSDSKRDYKIIKSGDWKSYLKERK